MRDDSDLHHRFAALRAADAARAPAFAKVLHRKRRPAQPAGYPPKYGLIAAAAVFAGITAAIFHLCGVQAPGTRGTDVPALADWRAPTDFLLETPARELLRTVPRIGQPFPETPGKKSRRDSTQFVRSPSGEMPI